MLQVFRRAVGCVLALASWCVGSATASNILRGRCAWWWPPPGGLTDIVARSVSEFLQEKLGQPFIVENIAGASSTIGAVQVARSAADRLHAAGQAIAVRHHADADERLL